MRFYTSMSFLFRFSRRAHSFQAYLQKLNINTHARSVDEKLEKLLLENIPPIPIRNISYKCNIVYVEWTVSFFPNYFQ